MALTWPPNTALELPMLAMEGTLELPLRPKKMLLEDDRRSSPRRSGGAHLCGRGSDLDLFFSVRQCDATRGDFFSRRLVPT
jgi:hypothetical protein